MEEHDQSKAKDALNEQGTVHTDIEPVSPPLSSFLGKPIEICIVTSSHIRTLTALTALGIGPWRIYDCSPSNTTAQTYRGRPSAYTLRFCYADLPGGMTYEVISPVSGPSIFQEFLDGLQHQRASGHLHGNGDDATGQLEGVHHIAYDCNNIPMAARHAGFAARGYECVQSGVWHGGAAFAFFESVRKEGKGVWWETIEIPTEEEGWAWPEAEAVFPEE